MGGDWASDVNRTERGPLHAQWAHYLLVIGLPAEAGEAV